MIGGVRPLLAALCTRAGSSCEVALRLTDAASILRRTPRGTPRRHLHRMDGQQIAVLGEGRLPVPAARFGGSP